MANIGHSIFDFLIPIYSQFKLSNNTEKQSATVK